jgi:hypothetical protein
VGVFLAGRTKLVGKSGVVGAVLMLTTAFTVWAMVDLG